MQHKVGQVAPRTRGARTPVEIEVRRITQDRLPWAWRRELVARRPALGQQRQQRGEQGGARRPSEVRLSCGHQGLVAGNPGGRHSARRCSGPQLPRRPAFSFLPPPSAELAWRFTPKSPTRRWRPSWRSTTSAAWWRSAASPRAWRTATFRCAPHRATIILTLYQRRVDPAELPWFLGLMEHLAKRGIVCPLPVHGRDGVALRHLCGRNAAITTFLPGVWPRRVRPEHCAPVGAALAALHVAGRDYAPTRQNALGPHGWTPLLERSRSRADEVQDGLAEELERALTGILAAWPRELPTGHIHADLFPDNVFFLDGRAVRADRLLLRRHRHPGLRRRGVPERLVLRARFLLQRHQGTGDAARLRRNAWVVRCREGGIAGAVPGCRDPLPADAAV